MLFTSESVTQGHPDKIADQISDAILDAVLAQDRRGRVACETLVKTGFVVLAGEITTTAAFEYPAIVRKVVREIGYTDARWGFDADSCAVLCAVERQSPDIAQGVDEREGKSLGAGDQGMMFGYACNETEQLMPAPITYAHALTRGLARLRESGEIAWLRPDGKAQVSVEYDDRTRKPRRITTVVVSTQHAVEGDAGLPKDRAKAQKRIHADLKVESHRAGAPCGIAGRQDHSPHQPDRPLRDRRPAGRLAASPAGRSSSTPTAAWAGTAAARSPARTRRRSTAAPRTWRATSRRTSSPRGWPTGARSSSPTRSAIAEPVSVLVETFGTAQVDEREDLEGDPRTSSR